jgi:hypothetical protein
MKKIVLTIITSLVITLTVFTQSAGDYRSIGNGNWNDHTKWETFDGSNWVSASSYPGQYPGTGVVTVINGTEIILTIAVPYPIASLSVTADSYCSCSQDNYSQTAPHGILTVSSESAVSLSISGGVYIYGEFRIEDRIGAKTHTIFIEGSLVVGNEWYASTYVYDEEYGYYHWEYYYYQTPTVFRTINQDDKLSVTFNTTDPNSTVSGLSTISVSFQDVTFNGTGIGWKLELKLMVLQTLFLNCPLRQFVFWRWLCL